MPIATKPFSMNNVSLTLKTTGAGTAIEYKCQLQRAELVPSASTTSATSDYPTFCETHSIGGGSATTWTLELSGFQAWADATDLSNLLFDEDGNELEYVLTPAGGVVSATNPSFSGTVTASPTPVGGSANSVAQFSVSLQCTGKPDKNVAPASDFELVS